MFRKMTVGKKIFLGFTAVLLLLIIVTGAAYKGLNAASKGFTNYREMARDTNLAGRLQSNMLMVRMNVKDYLITGSDQDLEQYDKYWQKMAGFQAEAQKEIQTPERADKIDAIETALADYKDGFTGVQEYMDRRNNNVNGVLNVKGPLMENTLTEIMVSAYDDNDLAASYYTGLAMKHLLLARLYMAKFLDTNDQSSANRVHEEFSKMQDNLNILDNELQNPERRTMLTTVSDAKKTYITAFDGLVNAIFERNEIIEGTLDRLGPEIATDIEDVKLDIKSVQDTLGPKLVSSNNRSITTIAVISIIALVLGVLLSSSITKGITGQLNNVIDGLNAGSDQVASASQQLSSSSQQLAEGASEQAASIEETSSSLEEMSAMTKQNAVNADEADDLMKEANHVVNQANDSMSELTTSMQNISKASEETSKIIKTIDEIAFQTNLLALNAAVEAARAGEAGAGFAVVADEVRSLAMRAAEASKNTAGLIEDTIERVKSGGELVDNTNQAFGEVTVNAGKVGAIVGEIATASNEQSRGIEQINKAVAEMDKVVQQNAANAEESASASEEMNAQAVQMRGYVANLMAMLEGNKSDNGFHRSQEPTILHSTPPNPKTAPASSTLTSKRMAAMSGPKGMEMSPEKLIPMEDDDFEDF